MRIVTGVRRAGTAVVLSLLSVSAFSRGVVCHLPGISGYEREASEAKQHLGEFSTSSLDDAKLYLTVRSGSLYVHSNYKPFGEDYPTKLASDEFMDLRLVVANIAGDRDGMRSEFAMRSASFIVDDALLKSPEWSQLDFSEVGKLEIVKDGQTRRAHSFRGDDGESRWVLEYGEGVFVDAAKDDGAKLVGILRAQRFSKDDIHLVSFSLNSATVDRVKNMPNAITFEATSNDALRAELSKHTGKMLFALGHVEEGAFVTRDASGKAVFRIGVPELEALALECCQVRVFAVGCHTAETVSRGMLATFNTLKALDRYEAGLQATTMLGFLEAIAGSDARLAMVVDSALIAKQVTSEIRVMASESGERSPLRGREVARIWYSGSLPPPPALSSVAGGTADGGGGSGGESSSGDGCATGCFVFLIALGVAIVYSACQRMSKPAQPS